MEVNGVYCLPQPARITIACPLVRPEKLLLGGGIFHV
jgi:hypothetical protein